jgi:TetR/AcrR family transcriptional repressor of nem operon
VAERLVQTRGFNGFSYADVATELGVTKASLHYHFASKAELGLAMLDRYRAALVASQRELDASFDDPVQRLRGYVEFYESVLRNERMCLCGMLAAEVSTLPDVMQKSVNELFRVQEAWVAGVLEAGRRLRVFRFEGAGLARARLLIAALEGAMLIARSFGDARRLTQAATQVMTELGVTLRPVPRLPVAARLRRVARPGC